METKQPEERHINNSFSMFTLKITIILMREKCLD